MARAAQSRTVRKEENLFGGLFKKLTTKKETYRRSASKGSTLSDDARREARAELTRKRKEHLEDLRYQKEAARLKRELAKLDTKVEKAEEKIDKAKARERGGHMSESEFEKVKARQEAEIRKYEEGKRKALAKSQNPAVSAAQYHLAQAVLHGSAFKPMPPKVAREIVARTPAKLRSEFSRNPSAKSATFYRFSGGGGTYQNFHTAKQYAQQHADATGQTVVMESAKGGKSWKRYTTIHPKKTNPRNAGRYSKRKHKKFMKGQGFSGSDIQYIRSKGKKKGNRNPLPEAAALSEKFHGRPARTVERVKEKVHEHRNLTKLGDLVRLVVDTPTGKVVYLNFNLTDPRKVVRLASSEDRDKETGEVIGKQLYLRGGDQEVNLKAMGMDSPEWIRDKMELGRLHEFPADSKEGSIVYRARKKYNNFKLTDWWHKTGEDSGADNEAAAALLRKYKRKQISGPAARPLLVYDHKNKLLEIVGGQYFVDAPGIIN